MGQGDDRGYIGMAGSTGDITNGELGIGIHDDFGFQKSGIRFFTNKMDIKDANNKGLEYDADYSANFTSRSLIDKEYADGLVGGGGADGLGPDGAAGDLTIGGSGTTATINNNVVTDAKLSDMPNNTIKGRNGGSAGDPENLTATEVRELISLPVVSGSYLPTLSDSDYTITENESYYYKIGQMCTVVISIQVQEVGGNLDNGTLDISIPFAFYNGVDAPSSLSTTEFVYPVQLLHIDNVEGPTQTTLNDDAGAFLIGAPGSNTMYFAKANKWDGVDAVAGQDAYKSLNNIRQNIGGTNDFFSVSASFTYRAN
jgi:hypothetical protein